MPRTPDLASRGDHVLQPQIHAELVVHVVVGALNRVRDRVLVTPAVERPPLLVRSGYDMNDVRSGRGLPRNDGLRIVRLD